ncbi:hypothetical protein CN887_20835 [Bacillus pseudomycoides]|uniref:hypothetical protein n=1 Tax=Bacillus pseudomycoides TaxID=64104 RepID=UPI0001A16910|nr:hypothetical protein [Bacillus pseudomycoides]EEM06224.1 hypothetical protein bmyco0002_10840 [Bacillus pseudomycoides]PDZ72479.1 hypothetical protein CON58_18440 [Bacillus pseudomycoides]PEJ23417.1 hypothetical protein CN887_20835 [Bacillus pseudomycoides]PEM41491.1 hypothetical protein CN634_01510 [Bacillus pseudomycoides]
MDTTWETYLEWRGNKGFTGISTQEQYEEFLTECEPSKEKETEKLTKSDADEMKKIMKDVLATSQEQATFDAFKDDLHQGLTISYDELADLTGTPVRTLKRHIGALAHKGYLHILKGKTKNTYYYGADMKTNKKQVLPVSLTEWNFDSIANDLHLEDDWRFMLTRYRNKWSKLNSHEHMKHRVKEALLSFYFSHGNLDEKAFEEYNPAQYMNIFVTYGTHENAMKEVLVG